MIYTKMPEDKAPDSYIIMGMVAGTKLNQARSTPEMRKFIAAKTDRIRSFVPWSLLTDEERRRAWNIYYRSRSL